MNFNLLCDFDLKKHQNTYIYVKKILKFNLQMKSTCYPVSLWNNRQTKQML